MNQRARAFLQIKEVADLLGIHVATAQIYARKGLIKGFKVGRKWYFEKENFLEGANKNKED